MYSLENTKFYLDFAVGNSSGAPLQRYEIAEPTGFDASHFKLQQEDGRMGRDVFFAPVDLEFNPAIKVRGLTHEFTRLVNTYTSRGFEGMVNFVIEVSSVEYVVGQLDFNDAVTDLTTYFICKVIQEGLQAKIKRRADIKVDLFSDENIDGETISYLVPNEILLRAQPLFQESNWETPSEKTFQGADPPIYFNPAVLISDAGVDDTFSPYPGWIQLSSETEALQDFKVIEASESITDATLTFSNGAWDFTGSVAYVLRVRQGVDIATSELIYNEDMDVVETDFSASIEISELPVGEKLFVYFRAQALSAITFTFTSFDVNFTAISTSISSVINGVHLKDAMRQVIKSIAGTTVLAPRWDVDGEFYNQFVFKGNQVRQITDKPLTMSLNDILDYLPEVNADYKVLPDGTVFFGIEADFYNTTTESGEFEMYPNAVFKKTTNPKYAVNRLSYEYSKFESGNNDLQQNSLEGIHTETQWSFENRMVENNKDIAVGFVRDAFLLEKVRKESIIVTEDAVTSEDDEIFILDCIVSDAVQFTEYMRINHDFNVSETVVRLFNDGSFNFTLLGLQVGDIIGCSIPYVASLEITEINERDLICDVISIDTPVEGIFLTDLGWTLADIIVNRTDEGFFNIQNTNLPNGFSNMLYSPRRNMIKYYGSFIKTASKFYPTGLVRNTFYKNGGEIFFNFAEDGDFYVGQANGDIFVNIMPPAIVTPFLIETEVICTFSQFWSLVTSVREDDGYVTIKTNKGDDVRVYPQELDYDWGNFRLLIKGELKIT